VEGEARMKITVKVEADPGEEQADALVYAETLQNAANLFVEKNRFYGGAFREQGWMGNLARIMSKTARLRSMQWRPAPLDDANETVDDTLVDLVNLSVFGIINRQERNIWGRRG
jgi:maltose-binding protein MalE